LIYTALVGGVDYLLATVGIGFPPYSVPAVIFFNQKLFVIAPATRESASIVLERLKARLEADRLIDAAGTDFNRMFNLLRIETGNCAGLQSRARRSNIYVFSSLIETSKTSGF
jgi:hypothetical protein